MRLCFLSDSAGVRAVFEGGSSARAGGAEKQVCALMRGLAARGHDVTLVHPVAAGTRTRIDGVELVPLPLSVRQPWTVGRLWRLLRETRPDVVYARLPSDFLLVAGLYARRTPGTRFAYAVAYDPYCRPWGTAQSNGWFHDTLYALALRTTSVVLLQHDGQRDLLAPHLRQRTTIVRNLVEPVAAAPRRWSGTAFDGVWVGHRRPEKRLELYLDLVAALPQLRFALVGGAAEDSARQRSQSARIASLANLHDLGLAAAEQCRDLIRTSRVLVNTSAHEGFPNTMLEAWSSGVPVVSLTVDPSGVIARERLGLVSTTSEQLRTDVALMCEDEEANHDVGRRALDYARRLHSAPVVLEQFLDAVSSTAPAAPIASPAR